eukprot:19211-Pyramimonas_sp.AAC.1
MCWTPQSFHVSDCILSKGTTRLARDFHDLEDAGRVCRANFKLEMYDLRVCDGSWSFGYTNFICTIQPNTWDESYTSRLLELWSSKPSPINPHT